MQEINIREHALPGLGHRYEMEVDRGRRLVITVRRDGRRIIGLGERDADEWSATVALDQHQAMVVASLLTGVRVSIDTHDDDRVAADEVAVQTVTLGERSPAVGLRVEQITLPDHADAAVLAVIRDETPELVEQEDQPTRVGDRVVVVARRERLDDVLWQLSG